MHAIVTDTVKLSKRINMFSDETLGLDMIWRFGGTAQSVGVGQSGATLEWMRTGSGFTSTAPGIMSHFVEVRKAAAGVQTVASWHANWLAVLVKSHKREPDTCVCINVKYEVRNIKCTHQNGYKY